MKTLLFALLATAALGHAQDDGATPRKRNVLIIPANHHPPRNECDIMALMRKSYHASSVFPVGDFGEQQWREYLWAYYGMNGNRSSEYNSSRPNRYPFDRICP